MTQPYKAGELPLQRIIEYIEQQDTVFAEVNLFRYCQDFLGVQHETLRRCIDYLLDEDLLTHTTSLEGQQYITANAALYEQLNQRCTQTLTQWLQEWRTPANDQEPDHRGPGAPIGNTNALTHGKYSRKLSFTYGDHLPNDASSVSEELQLVRAMLADLNELTLRPADLILRTVATIGRLVVLENKLLEARREPPTNKLNPTP